MHQFSISKIKKTRNSSSAWAFNWLVGWLCSSISEIIKKRNSSSARAFYWYTPGHSWHNHHRRRHLLFLFGDYYEIGGLWVLERNIDVIKTRVFGKRVRPEIGFPILQGDVVFEHRDRQTSQYPGAESC